MHKIEFIKEHVKLFKEFKKNKEFCSGMELFNKSLSLDVKMLITDLIITHDQFLANENQGNTEITTAFLLLEALQYSGFIVVSSTSDTKRLAKFFGFFADYIKDNIKET
jgi:hypothetical protein